MKTNMPHLLVTKLFLTLVLLSLAPMVMALDQFTFPFEEIVVCPTSDGDREEIYLKGTGRLQEQFIENAHHTTYIFQIFWRMSGYGLTSDAEYSLRGKWMEVVQGIEGNSPFIFLWNDHFQLVGKGKAENFRLYYKIRMVVNANGETTVDFEDSFECETVWTS
jgi:hypothetical protein